MEQIRGQRIKSTFACGGTFVKFLDPSDNYQKVTVFMLSTLSFCENRLTIANHDFDLQQGQVASYDFSVQDEMYLTRFSALNEEARIVGIKWRSLLRKTDYFGFEFDN